MSDLHFAELPPPSGNGQSFWREIALELRSRPGEWAAVKVYPLSSKATVQAAHINAGRNIGMLGCEAKSRGATVWARYLGGTS